MVILFGSRATGRQQEDSVVDLMVVTLPDYPPASRVGASRAARDYLEDDPPPLEVNVIQMSRREFDYCRSAKQHIAGQAANHGIILNGDRLAEPPPREDGSPAHWVETQRCIQRALENNREFAAMVDRNYRSRKLLGFYGQQAAEHVLKGWLSAYTDGRDFRHNLTGTWNAIVSIEDWSNPGHDRLEIGYRTCSSTFDATAQTLTPDSKTGSPDTETSLDLRNKVSYPTAKDQWPELQRSVDRGVTAVVERVHAISGAIDAGVWPGGTKPRDGV